MKRKITAMLLLVCMLCSIVPINALVGASNDNIGTFDTMEEKVYAVEENPVEDSISNDNISETSGIQNESMDITMEGDSADSSELQNADDIEESDIDSSSDIQENEERQEVFTEPETSSLYNADNQATIQSDGESEEPENDNWELGLVFYDSSVDNGKTPLTEIDWDASDGGYGEGTPRVITVQINYKNTNTVTTYQPGKLEISIPNLIYNTSSNTENSPLWKSSAIVGANDSMHTGYDWNFNSYPDSNIYKFTNANIIEEEANFQGSIQIIFTITPKKEEPETYIDNCIHSYSKTLEAKLDNITKSNEISMRYIRKYKHTWEKTKYELSKNALKISSLDGLENANDYIWVKYQFITKKNTPSSNLVIDIQPNSIYVQDVFPEDCVIYSSNLKKLNNENNTYKIYLKYSSIASYPYNGFIYCGYPKKNYNEETDLNIENYAELYGVYYNEEQEAFLSSANIKLNLADFNFVYNGDLYGIKKNYLNSSSSKTYYDALTGEYVDIGNSGKLDWQIDTPIKYTGTPLTIVVGDDLLYITRNDGSISKLRDNEYYFSSITLPLISNGNNIKIKDTYNCKLYVRYGNSSEYILYDECKYIVKSWNFSKEDNVVGYYIEIEDMVESISKSNFRNTLTINNAEKISHNGTIYNFSYLKIYANGELQNEPNLNSYENFITKEKIAEFDKATYNSYLQRSCANCTYSKYNPPVLENMLQVNKSMTSFSQDAINEYFLGTASLSMMIGAEKIDAGLFNHYYKDNIDVDGWIDGYELFELLPDGLELISTADEIKQLTRISMPSSYIYYDKNYNIIKKTDVDKLMKENLSVELINNYNNTNRTYIHYLIDIKDNHIIMINGDSSFRDFLYSSYKYKVSYDSFLEYGSIWSCPLYAKFYNRLTNEDKQGFNKGYWFGRGWPTIHDNGAKDKDITDIDNNNNTDELLAYKTATATITSVISTHQDVQKSVKTDQSNYSTGTVKSSYDSEYEYKLRVRTGQNNITNLVIYDSIEEYAQNSSGDMVTAYGNKKHWNGEFLGIDTSYAESKGYKVKTYYSEDVKAGNLADDNSWKEYSEATDKSKVKSLAFEYLDAEGNPARLPANSLTYVLIKMKSPADENIASLAYNGCRTQWNALDDYDRPVDFITGINSNIVKVSLPNSIEDKEVNLHFNKMISGTDEAFEKLKLNKDNSYSFYITLENQDTGDIINGTVDNKDGFTVNNVPIGTYIIRELDDIWFKFVNMAFNESIDGIEFEEADGNYVIIINASVESGTTATIDVTNKTDDERFYDNKYDVKNLFNPTT